MDASRREVLTGIKEHLDGRGIDTSSLGVDSRILEDLDLDSLDTVELTLGLEKRFGVEISDEDAEGLETVGDVIDLIEAKRSAVGA